MDILQELKYERQCHPLKPNQRILHCAIKGVENQKCDDKFCCIKAKIEIAWNKSGFPIIGDKHIRKNLEKLVENYEKLAKNAKRDSQKKMRRDKNS